MRGVPSLTGAFWKNEDTQSHFFVSFLKEKFPGAQEKRGLEKIEARPGEIAVLPHKFYRIYSRDNTPCRGSWLQGVEVLGEKDSKKHMDRAGLKLAKE